MKTQLTPRTSIKTIQQMIADDFQVFIDNDLAENIRKHAGRDLIVWTPDHLKCVANDLQLEIMTNSIVWFGTGYTNKEWNIEAPNQIDDWNTVINHLTTPEFDPFVDEWHADQLRGASFEFVRTFLDQSNNDYWYWEDYNVYPFEHQAQPVVKLTAYRLGLLRDCNRENGIDAQTLTRFKPQAKSAVNWLIRQGLMIKHKNGDMFVALLGEQYLILYATNAQAANDDEIMEVGEARHILAKAIINQTESDTDGDSFGDWAFGGGIWDSCQTVDQAWDQVVLFAQQWDDLSQQDY